MTILQCLTEKRGRYVKRYCLRPDYCLMHRKTWTALQTELKDHPRHREESTNDRFLDMNVMFVEDESVISVGKLE